ncbi:unnamed protein product [Callosobruchus maculatus]|uniref:Uncharacterized protein n=1 Tax=Callosobruchus maculatus TaxID=64391 RepID=A0A653C6T4_CALMS|nr:unnamed protein product [Callosobruchus maculatus]
MEQPREYNSVDDSEAMQSCFKDAVSSKVKELALGVYLAKASDSEKNTKG